MNKTECPACGKEDFKTENGMKSHHKIVHGESIAGVLVSCACCSSEIRVQRHDAKNCNHHFCSDECNRQYKIKDRGTCEWCGAERPVSANIEGVYCSTECMGKAYSEKYDESVELECEICGDVRKVSPSAEKRLHTCGDAGCHGKWRSLHYRGENAPRWNGGHDTYYGPSWESQKKKALKRDGYSCVRCGIGAERLGKNPDVHHRIKFKKFGVEKHEEANKLSNLVTLCHSCHAKIETHPVQPEVVPA